MSYEIVNERRPPVHQPYLKVALRLSDLQRTQVDAWAGSTACGLTEPHEQDDIPMDRQILVGGFRVVFRTPYDQDAKITAYQK